MVDCLVGETAGSGSPNHNASFRCFKQPSGELRGFDADMVWASQFDFCGDGGLALPMSTVELDGVTGPIFQGISSNRGRLAKSDCLSSRRGAKHLSFDPCNGSWAQLLFHSSRGEVSLGNRGPVLPMLTVGLVGIMGPISKVPLGAEATWLSFIA